MSQLSCFNDILWFQPLQKTVLLQNRSICCLERKRGIRSSDIFTSTFGFQLDDKIYETIMSVIINIYASTCMYMCAAHILFVAWYPIGYGSILSCLLHLWVSLSLFQVTKIFNDFYAFAWHPELFVSWHCCALNIDVFVSFWFV